MRISDWSSDVCSSDLQPMERRESRGFPPVLILLIFAFIGIALQVVFADRVSRRTGGPISRGGYVGGFGGRRGGLGGGGRFGGGGGGLGGGGRSDEREVGTGGGSKGAVWGGG